MRRFRNRLQLIALCCVALSVSSCIWIIRSVEVDSIQPTAPPTEVGTPVKAHLIDGSTVVFENGATFTRDSVRGQGKRFGLTGDRFTAVTALPLDSVAAMEAFRPVIHGMTSFLISTVSTGAAVLGVAAASVAIFGSCPTIYSDSAGSLALEAEAFSYSIAPLFERRDVDRLQARADDNGRLRLEIRNEALETHYINQLELLETRHVIGEVVAPDGENRLVAVGGLRPPSRATDRAGRDLRATLAANDSLIFRTDAARLRAANADDLGDYIDVTVPTPDSDSAAVVFTARNSLLNTVLFYDIMLADPGARSLDWMGSDLANIGPAVALGRWYGARMGMKVAVRRGGAWEPVMGVPDAGPIAWRTVTAVVPVPREDSLRVRLSFVADQWRINSVAVASRVRRIEPRSIPVGRVVRSDGTPDTTARAALRSVDSHYLQTMPGDRLTTWFDAGVIGADSARTFLVASHGYYTEWVRGDWLRGDRRTAAFVPSDSSLAIAVDRWRTVQVDFERRFETSRIPVR